MSVMSSLYSTIHTKYTVYSISRLSDTDSESVTHSV